LNQSLKKQVAKGLAWRGGSDILQQVLQAVFAITFTRLLTKAILEILPIINNERVAIYHFANLGNCSWFEFTKAIFKIKDIDVVVHPIPTSQYSTPAKRPHFSVMMTDKIRNNHSLQIPAWKDSLRVILK
jgi:dTDP-4-dehydrorhamnose reductase